LTLAKKSKEIKKMRVLSSIFLICLLFFNCRFRRQTPNPRKTFFKQGTPRRTKSGLSIGSGFSTNNLFGFPKLKNITEDKSLSGANSLQYRAFVIFNWIIQLRAVKEFTLAIDLSDKHYQKAFLRPLGYGRDRIKKIGDNARTAFFLNLSGFNGSWWRGVVWSSHGFWSGEKDYENARRAFFPQSIKYNSISKSAGYNNMGRYFSALSSDFPNSPKIKEF